MSATQRVVKPMKDAANHTMVKLGEGVDKIIVPWRVDNSWLKVGLVSKRHLARQSMSSFCFPEEVDLAGHEVLMEELFTEKSVKSVGAGGLPSVESRPLFTYPEVVLNTLQVYTWDMGEQFTQGSDLGVNGAAYGSDLFWFTVSDLRNSVAEGRICTGPSLVTYAMLEATGFLNRGVYL